jgi:FtsH-binding integral membrane protein
VPWNYLLLLLATVAEACSVAALTAHYEVGAVLSALFVLAITLVCLFGSSLYVRESVKLQKTLAMSVIVSAFVTLFLTPFILMNTYGNKYEWAWVALAVVMCLATCAYIIFDLLYIMDLALIAKDEYIIGAFILYMDVVRLFVYILVLLSDQKKKN